MSLCCGFGKTKSALDWLREHRPEYTQFLKTRLNADACDSEYPGYCNSASEILAIYLIGRFGVDADVVAGEAHGHEGSHVWIQMNDWIIDPTVVQFLPMHDLVLISHRDHRYLPCRDGTTKPRNSRDKIRREFVARYYKPDWAEYLEGILASYAKEQM